MLNEPLSQVAARQLARAILAGGTYRFTRHADRELENDDLTQVDAVNVLRAGQVDHIDCVNGAWRYQIKTQRMCVVVEFESAETLIIITAWRINP